MILYRKSGSLRIRRSTFPQPPFWFATAVAPYAGRRATPLAIDYVALTATGQERLEVAVAEGVREELERSPRLREPVLVDAAEHAEEVFRSGSDALQWLGETSTAAVHLISTEGVMPQSVPAGATLVIAAWPVNIGRLEQLFKEAAERGGHWGALVPLMFPATTRLELLDTIAAAAKRHQASFLASVPIETDPTAKHALAQTIELGGEDEEYAMLFHADLEPILVATERHVAALAAANGMEDFVVPPRWEQRSNWNASVLLTLTAARMIAMAEDLELAGQLGRSARVVAELEKPLARIAEAASLSIVESLDEVSVDILTDWIETGRSPFVEKVNRHWRLRRDAGV